MNELVSVIVPVYKTEKYLNHCINSIVGQTYNNLEIILVDDGSPDRCPAICDLWKEKDERIKVFHQVNAGGGQARNLALDKSKGKFVIFVDSDDYIAPFMIEFLYKQFQDDVDIVECGYCITHNDNAEFDEESEGYRWESFGAEEAVLENIKDRMFRQIIWNKMYRKSVVGDVRFPVHKNIDDEFWTYQAVERAEKIVQIEDVGSYYFFREDSIINETYNIRRLDALEARYQRMKYLEKYPEIYGVAKRQLVFNCMYHYQKGLRFLSGSDLKKLKSKVKAIYKDISIDKNDIKEYTKKEKIWFSISKISLDLVCRIRNKFGYGVE